jgi:hypothetical protein
MINNDPRSRTDPYGGPSIANNLASQAGGPAGVGGSGGYGFTNIQQYMYANPSTRTGYAAMPTGAGYSQGDSTDYGYAGRGTYTPGMSSYDNALNQAYGNTGYKNPPAAVTPPPGPVEQMPEPDWSQYGGNNDMMHRLMHEAWSKGFHPKPGQGASGSQYPNINASFSG